MLFPQTFEKWLIATNGFQYAAGQKTIDLAPGKVGVFNPSVTNYPLIQPTAAGVPASTKDLPMIGLAQGVFRANDKIGPFHGGYQETVKTKGINPRHTHRFYVTTPKDAQAQIITLGGIVPQLMNCGTGYNLRVDVKGSQVLRFLNHYLYKTFYANSGCCPVDPAASQLVDPAIVFEQWADQINNDVLFKPFIVASVKYGTVDGSGAVVANVDAKPANWNTTANTVKFCQLKLSVIYGDTTFTGNGSFQQTDFVETDLIQMYASVVDDLDNPCDLPYFPVTEVQQAKFAEGSGEFIVRDLILFKRYRQEFYVDDLRLREVTGDTTLDEISRSTKYFVYHILHSVPRKGNPSSTRDDDYYTDKIVVTARNADFEAFIQGYLDQAGTGVKLEVL